MIIVCNNFILIKKSLPVNIIRRKRFLGIYPVTYSQWLDKFAVMLNFLQVISQG
jgi:hypothetical protein